MSKKERVKSKIGSIEPVIEKEIVLTYVKDETSDEILEVLPEEAKVVDEIEKEDEAVSQEQLTLTCNISESTGWINVNSTSETKEPFYALDVIESKIFNATKIGNHYLASELHKVSAILSDLNHTFLHLSGEAKLVISIVLKNGKILKC